MKDIDQIINKFNIPIKEVKIASGLLKQINQILEKLGFENKQTLFITDSNIYNNISHSYREIIENSSFEKLILQAPKADENNINQILQSAKNYKLIIGLGSGTINDLCKLSSFKMNISYIIFASAASMSGYASANASISVNKLKQSLQAHLPLAIYYDLDIIKNAPQRLTKAGIGDSMCYSTCQFDWLLSHLILNTEYNPDAFEILHPFHQQLINFEGNSLKGDKLIELLCIILTISGLAMCISKGSYPASQAEHMVAHYLDMQYPKIMAKSFHGEQIAVTTLSMADIQEAILQEKQLQIKPSIVSLEEINAIFSPKLAKLCQKEVEEKIFSQQKTDKINQLLKDNWQNIKNKLKSVFISKIELLKLAKKFDLPTKAEDIEVNEEIYKEALKNANLIRNRFTALDIYNLKTKSYESN